MDIKIVGKDLKATEAIKDYTAKKLERIEKYFEGDIDVLVTIKVEKNGNVRITFDRNISGCDKVTNFFEEKIQLVLLLPAGWHVLEVKYDEFLPDYIKDVLEIGILQRTAFSKYYYARNYKNDLAKG